MPIEWEIEAATETTEYQGRLKSLEQYEIGSTVNFTSSTLSIPVQILREKQHWLGMRASTKGIVYEYETVFTNQEFANEVDVIGIYTFEKLSQQFGVPLPQNLNGLEKVPMSLNFSGTKYDLISLIADSLNRTWALALDKTIAYKNLSPAALNFPTVCLSATLEDGYFGSGVYNGVQYEKLRSEEAWVTHYATIKREKCRVTLEPPFEDNGKNYCIAVLEMVEPLPFETVLQVQNPTAPVTLNPTPGLTDQKKSTVKEWNYEVKKTQAGLLELIDEVVFKIRIAVEYAETSADPIAATVEKLWNEVFNTQSRSTFSMPVKIKFYNRITVSQGTEPFLKISTSRVPLPFADNFALKILFQNTRRKRLTYEYVASAQSPPVLITDSNVIRVRYFCDCINDVLQVRVEVIG